MMTGADPVFADTNSLVYATVASAPLHPVAQSRLRTLEDSGRVIWISRQVLREYLAVLTRPNLFAQPAPIEVLLNQIAWFERHYRLADDDAAVTSELALILRSVPVGGKQIHDANIVATMRSRGIRDLLTHNVGDFARFAGLISILPLVPSA